MEEKNNIMEFSNEQFIYAVLGFQLLEYAWELYLSIRQHQMYNTVENVPPDLQNVMEQETFTKARLYGNDKSRYGIFKGLITTIVSTIFLLLNGFHFFWALSQSTLLYLGLDPLNEIQTSMAFIVLTNIFNTIIDIPFSVYYTFVLEEKHGFNKQTAWFFIKDKIKAFFVAQVIMMPLIAGIVTIVRWGGTYFFIYLWGFSTVVMLFLMTIYPDYIAPLFDKYTPLPEGELRTSIEQLAASVKFPLYKLYVVEGSKRSVHSNAYFYGFFKNKRIVLFDTLLKDFSLPDKKTDEGGDSEDAKKEKAEKEKKGCSDEEVLAVLAHELGHWQLNHIFKNIVIMQVNMLLMFAGFGFMCRYEPMYQAFGFTSEQPVLIGMVIVLQYIFAPYNAVLSFAMTSLSRRFEFQADAFAVLLGRAEQLKDALIKLNADNLSFPVYDWLYSAWHHSHPPLLERLSALKKSQ